MVFNDGSHTWYNGQGGINCQPVAGLLNQVNGSGGGMPLSMFGGGGGQSAGGTTINIYNFGGGMPGTAGGGGMFPGTAGSFPAAGGGFFPGGGGMTNPMFGGAVQDPFMSAFGGGMTDPFGMGGMTGGGYIDPYGGMYGGGFGQGQVQDPYGMGLSGQDGMMLAQLLMIILQMAGGMGIDGGGMYPPGEYPTEDPGTTTGEPAYPTTPDAVDYQPDSSDTNNQVNASNLFNYLDQFSQDDSRYTVEELRAAAAVSSDPEYKAYITALADTLEASGEESFSDRDIESLDDRDGNLKLHEVTLLVDNDVNESPHDGFRSYVEILSVLNDVVDSEDGYYSADDLLDAANEIEDDDPVLAGMLEDMAEIADQEGRLISAQDIMVMAQNQGDDQWLHRNEVEEALEHAWDVAEERGTSIPRNDQPEAIQLDPTGDNPDSSALAIDAGDMETYLEYFADEDGVLRQRDLVKAAEDADDPVVKAYLERLVETMDQYNVRDITIDQLTEFANSSESGSNGRLLIQDIGKFNESDIFINEDDNWEEALEIGDRRSGINYVQILEYLEGHDDGDGVFTIAELEAAKAAAADDDNEALESILNELIEQADAEGVDSVTSLDIQQLAGNDNDITRTQVRSRFDNVVGDRSDFTNDAVTVDEHAEAAEEDSDTDPPAAGSPVEPMNDPDIAPPNYTAGSGAKVSDLWNYLEQFNGEASTISPAQLRHAAVTAEAEGKPQTAELLHDLADRAETFDLEVSYRTLDEAADPNNYLHINEVADSFGPEVPADYLAAIDGDGPVNYLDLAAILEDSTGNDGNWTPDQLITTANDIMDTHPNHALVLYRLAAQVNRDSSITEVNLADLQSLAVTNADNDGDYLTINADDLDGISITNHPDIDPADTDVDVQAVINLLNSVDDGDGTYDRNEIVEAAAEATGTIYNTFLLMLRNFIDSNDDVESFNAGQLGAMARFDEGSFDGSGTDAFNFDVTLDVSDISGLEEAYTEASDELPNMFS